MTTVEAQPGRHMVMHNITWQQYRSFADSIGEHSVRLTYDRGRLEFMTLSYDHERWKQLVAQFVEVLTEELDIPRQSAGSTTFERDDLERALEPDQCYYLQNESLVRDKERLDLHVDPPPDLAIEVEITRTAVNRMGIYAAMGIPEVWRFNGETLRVQELGSDGKYKEVTRSLAFPFLPLDQVVSFLRRRNEMNETRLIRSFRQWVKEQAAKGWPGA